MYTFMYLYVFVHVHICVCVVCMLILIEAGGKKSQDIHYFILSAYLF